MKTFGIISDTHGSLHAGVLCCLQGCDHIIHAGDIGASSILDDLKEIAPVTAILGNCDNAFEIRGLSRRITFDADEGIVFTVTHRPESLRREIIDLSQYYMSKQKPLPKIVGIHGHTHIPEIRTESQAKPANLIVCPGSVSNPRGGWVPTFAKIVIDNGKILCCEILNLKGEIEFSEEEI